jgi:hypothetical protein
MHRTDEQERRERRSKRAIQFAKEVAQWSSHKLRMAYAQPETVRAAEAREQKESRQSPSQEG